MEAEREEQQRTKGRRTVLIAGATGYLGRHLVAEFLSRRLEPWNVIALVRKPVTMFSPEVRQVVAQATDKESLKRALLPSNGTLAPQIDLVVSSLGITRQRDGLSYWDVDYQANMNLLEVSLKANVPHFAYIHVLNGPLLTRLGVDGVAAKQAFVEELEKMSSKALPKIRSTVICPSGFFSDMKDFLDMAQQGRAYLFGDGQRRINPIHGVDLAQFTVDACNSDSQQHCSLDVGGPDIYTHRELAELAFATIREANGRDWKPRITYLPDWIRRVLLWIVPYVTPKHIGGPAQMFLTAFGYDMVGQCRGTRHLRDFYMDLLKGEREKKSS